MSMVKKKVLFSGSIGHLEGLDVDTKITGSIDSSSYAESSSFADSLHQGGVFDHVGGSIIDLNSDYGSIHRVDIDASSSMDIWLQNPIHGGMYVLHMYNGSDSTINFVSESYYFVDETTSLESIAVDDEMVVFYCSGSGLYSNLYNDSNKHVNDVPYDAIDENAASTTNDIDVSGSARVLVKLDTANLTGGDTPTLNFKNMPSLGSNEASTITLHIIESTSNQFTFSVQKDGSAQSMRDLNGDLFSGTNNNEFTVPADTGSLFNITDYGSTDLYTDYS